MDKENIKTLQANIVQWTEMQNKLFNLVMKGLITKEEYKERNDSLSEDIYTFKKEIYELSLSKEETAWESYKTNGHWGF